MKKFIGIIIAYFILVFAARWIAASNIRTLASRGWVFYYSPDCGFCEKQIEQIGENKISWMPTVNCKENLILCKEKRINAYPTRYMKGVFL